MRRSSIDRRISEYRASVNACARISVYLKRVPVHGIVYTSHAKEFAFLRMIDERKCLVHFSYKNYLLQCFHFQLLFFTLFGFHKIIILTIMIE